MKTGNSVIYDGCNLIDNRRMVYNPVKDRVSFIFRF